MSQDGQIDFQPLSVGERGTMIYIVQKLLNRLGYELKEDGIFSDQMEENVKHFQGTRENLKVDGIVGYQTIKEMDELAREI